MNMQVLEQGLGRGEGRGEGAEREEQGIRRWAGKSRCGEGGLGRGGGGGGGRAVGGEEEVEHGPPSPPFPPNWG